MTRRERKHVRRQKQKTKIKKIHITPEMDKMLWKIARIMTLLPRDKSKDNQVLECGTGCYNLVGGKSYCKTCFYNYEHTGCLKMQQYREKEMKNGKTMPSL